MIKYLIQKEFRQIRRNSFLPRLIVMFPVLIMCVMPWVMNMEVKNIRVQVVDNDRSTLSQQLVHSIEASRYFVFGGQQPSYQAALKEIETGKTDVALVIPQHYSRGLTKGDMPQVLIAANAVNGTKGSMGGAYMSQIVTANASPNTAAIQSKLSSLFLYNKHLNYKVFMIPALLAVVMMLMCGFLPALNIVGEKESGTIEQINVTPVSKWSFILSKRSSRRSDSSSPTTPTPCSRPSSSCGSSSSASCCSAVCSPPRAPCPPGPTPQPTSIP